MKRELERIEIPGEHEAREQAWAVLQSAFAERTAVERRPRQIRTAVAFAVLLALVASAFSPPGQAVLDEIRDAVGVENAAPALFSLPAPGKLLVHSDQGVWVVQQDGSRRLLGDYREASWSPFGRYVVAARANELTALEPDGDVRWTLARRDVRSPRWSGTKTDTRIAYLTTSRVHVVAGDGSADVDAGGPAARVAPAWRPGARFVLAYVNTRGRVSVSDVSTGAPLWTTGPGWSRPFKGPRKLMWSTDGKRLLLVTRGNVIEFGLRSARPLSIRDEPVVEAAFRPGTHALASIRKRGATSELTLDERVLFRGTGAFQNLTWSPDGRWVLVDWPTANQWIFVRVSGARRIVAVANITAQFGGSARVEGWVP
jgi:hypothetical protein